VRRFFLQARSVHLSLQLLSEEWKRRVHTPPPQPPHMEQSQVPCDGSRSLMSTGSTLLCLPARTASNDNYERGSGKMSLYHHEVNGGYRGKGEFFMSRVFTCRRASGIGTFAGSPVPSVTCWCHVTQDSSSSAQCSIASPKCSLLVWRPSTGFLERR